MKTFVETVKAYSSWKLQETGSAKLSKSEIMALREEYQKEVKALKGGDEKITAQLKEACDNFLNWKKQNNKGDKITKVEFGRIKESLAEKNKADFNLYVSNYKKFKEAANQGNKLTEKEIKMLKENFKESIKTGVKLAECTEDFDPVKALKEQDMGMAPAAPADPMAGDPNAGMPPAPGAPGAPQDPMALQGAIDQIAGIVTPLSSTGGNDMGAIPGGGPAMDGGAAAAGPAPGAAPNLVEATNALLAWKKANGKGDTLTEAETKLLKEKFGPKEKSEYEKIKERIAEREAKIKALQEGAPPGNSVQDAQKKADAGKGLPTPGDNSRAGGYDQGSISTSEMGVKVPTPTQIANGVVVGGATKEIEPAATWPTKAMGKEAGGALQGKGATQTKIKEGEDPECKEGEESKGECLDEGTTVTDIYVQRSMEPKLDFQKIRESMKSGLLG